VVKALCILCGKAKGKRECQTLKAWLCPTCCATKRSRENCPKDCSYLIQGKAYQTRRAESQETSQKVPAPSKIIDEYSDVLENIEFMILEARRAYPDLTDKEVESALDCLVRTYDTKEKGIIYEFKSESPRVQLVIDKVNAILEYRMSGQDTWLRLINPREAILCLHFILDSVYFHISRKKGEATYLDFIGQFFKESESKSRITLPNY